MCLEEIELRVQKLITIVCSIVNITVVCLFVFLDNIFFWWWWWCVCGGVCVFYVTT